MLELFEFKNKSMNYQVFRIFGNLIPEELECFLEHFKCLTFHTKFSELTLFFLELKMIRIFSEFFKDKFIQCVNIYDWDETWDFLIIQEFDKVKICYSTPWLILLEKIQTDLIISEMSMVDQCTDIFLLNLPRYCNLNCFIATADFLLQLAAMTRSMITRQRCPSSNHFSAAFVHEILSRKCNKLEINTEMSLDDMEKLLQVSYLISSTAGSINLANQ